MEIISGLKRADAIGYIESAQARIDKLEPVIEQHHQKLTNSNQ